MNNNERSTEEDGIWQQVGDGRRMCERGRMSLSFTFSSNLVDSPDDHPRALRHLPATCRAQSRPFQAMPHRVRLLLLLLVRCWTEAPSVAGVTGLAHAIIEGSDKRIDNLRRHSNLLPSVFRRTITTTTGQPTRYSDSNLLTDLSTQMTPNDSESSFAPS